MSSTYELSVTNEVTTHFENILLQEPQLDESSSISSAIVALEKLKSSTVEPYVLSRIEPLENMLSIIKDRKWSLNLEDRNYILSALTYFSQEDDIIPDAIPGVGLLDDCIVIDIAAKKIEAELKSYLDFKNSAQIYSSGDDYSVKDWKKTKKQEANSRIRNRRRAVSKSQRTRGSRPNFRMIL